MSRPMGCIQLALLDPRMIRATGWFVGAGVFCYLLLKGADLCFGHRFWCSNNGSWGLGGHGGRLGCPDD